jgi:hypothetical protein
MDTRVFEEEKNAFAGKHGFLGDFVLPDYDVYNICNLKSLVGKIFGTNSLGPAAMPAEVLDEFNGVQKVMLVVMDGLGYNKLLTHVKQFDGVFSELITKGKLKLLTSGFPATTSTSLTSIFTGLKPAEHGVLGYLMFSREYGTVINTLDMKPVYGFSTDVEVAKDLSRRIKPWIPTLQMHGVNPTIITRGSIVGSGLSRVTYADQTVTPYALEVEMFIKARKALEIPGPAFVVLYFSGVDTLEHRYGPYSEEVTSVIQLFEFLLKDFFNKLSDDIKRQMLFMLTSDHGVCETQKTIYLKDFPEIASRLQLPPIGDSRAAFLFVKQGEKENVKNGLERNLEGFTSLNCKEIVDSGAFGRIPDLKPLYSAVGDLAELSKCPHALAYPYFEDDRTREQRGGHGGMTEEEVLVPLLSIRLSKI